MIEIVSKMSFEQVYESQFSMETDLKQRLAQKLFGQGQKVVAFPSGVALLDDDSLDLVAAAGQVQPPQAGKEKQNHTF